MKMEHIQKILKDVETSLKITRDKLKEDITNLEAQLSVKAQQIKKTKEQISEVHQFLEGK